MLVLCGDSEKCMWYVVVYEKNQSKNTLNSGILMNQIYQRIMICFTQTRMKLSYESSRITKKEYHPLGIFQLRKII